MLLSRFKYHRPADLSSALDVIERYGEDATAYAGGTELLLALKARVLKYQHLVDLKHISALKQLRREGNRLIVGSLVTHHQLSTDPLVRQLVPSYATLSENIANIRVRVAGTLGGNLCFAEPHADPPAMLAALGAKIRLVGPEGSREVSAAEFVQGEFTTLRADSEIMTEISIPVTRLEERFCYKKFGHLERPAVGVAVGCAKRPDGSLIYKIWLGAMADRPYQATKVESKLEGIPADALMDVLPELAVEATSNSSARDDLHGSADYKRHLAAVLMKRAVLEAAQSLKEL